MIRLTYDGKNHWFVLEGDPEPQRNATGQPVWLDLTLQRYDPSLADAKWVAEVTEDVRAAFLNFVE